MEQNSTEQEKGNIEEVQQENAVETVVQTVAEINERVNQERKIGLVAYAKGKRSGIFTGIIIGLIFALGVNLVILFFRDDKQEAIPNWAIDTTNESLDESSGSVLDENVIGKIEAIEKLIQNNYLEEYDEKQLKEYIYKGIVGGLGDIYSTYYTQEELQSLMETTSGTYKGIGVMVGQDAKNGMPYVVKVFDNSPAFEAGLQAGDIIYKVDDKEVSGNDLDTIVSWLKGKDGTVTLQVVREGENDYLTLEVERRKVEITTISGKMLDNHIGYIQITEFEQKTASQFKKKFEQLKEEGMKGLVIDVRDNPGGLLDSVTEMLDYILPEGLIVYTEDKHGNRDEIKSDAKTALDVPLAVIINGNSASASEIFAGAIQDYGVGSIVGTTSYGKGIVQSVIPLIDGTAVKLTIAKYFTPNGNYIHGVGIKPDVEVELPEGVGSTNLTEQEDTQLKKAIETVTQ